jgi:hypothetical protein
MRIAPPPTPPSGNASQPVEYAAVDPAGKLAAILFEKHAKQLWPVRNFEA